MHAFAWMFLLKVLIGAQNGAFFFVDPDWLQLGKRLEKNSNGGIRMPGIEWDDSFSVNNTEIDNQHKKWIEIFNIVHESLMAKDDTTYLTIAEVALKEMSEYALNHFSFEEEYMHEISFPGIVGHRRIHRDFETLIFSYYRDIREGRLVLNTEVLSLIKNWLLDHILIEDKKYAAFIKDKSTSR